MNHKIKILLVNPFQIHLVNQRGKIYNRVWPPLALANCAALLEEKGHEVQILDANALRLDAGEVAKRAKSFDKIFVTSSALDRWQCPNLDIEPFLDTVSRIMEVSEEVYILGYHGTVKPKELIELTGAKAVIRGEPEQAVTEICKERNLADIPGIAFREKNRIILTPDQKPLDLKNLPMPAFHLLPMKKYYYEVLGNHFTLFEYSRGCASRCSFCLLEMYGKGIRRKSLAQLIEEIDFAVQHLEVKTAYFMDLEFTVFRKQILELCEHLIQRDYGLQWTCQTRFDLIDDQLLSKMKKAGCRLIHFGAEAGSDKVLERVQKKITVKQIEEGMKMVHRAKIDSACFFILGLSESSQQDDEDTIQFAKKLNPTYALFHIATPYVGTPLYERMSEKEGNLPEAILFPEACLNGKELKDLKKTVRHAYIGYYLRPRYMLSRLTRGNLRHLWRQVKLLLSYL
jgi:radical SAM superfamily enzyme YgiQ (UPF0313 family)